MILYFDTSALVKRYFQEKHSDDVIAVWQTASYIASSFVAYAETMACFYRKKREGNIDRQAINDITAEFQRDWIGFIRVEVNEELKSHIDEALKKYPLKGFDAIHLVSAIVLKDKISDDFLFACFDKQLNRAALSEGLSILPSCEQYL
jgi:uncharacterized protein